jgi:hypothetical protein
MIRFGNKIVVFKIIVTNEIIRLGNEIILFWNCCYNCSRKKPYKELGKIDLSKDDHMKNQTKSPIY